MARKQAVVYRKIEIKPKARSSLAVEVPAAVSGMATSDDASSRRLRQDVDNAPVRILAGRPDQAAWAGGWLAAPAEQQNLSRASLNSYAERFRARERAEPEGSWPWRLVRSPASGLPSYMRGWLDQRLDNLDAAVDLALSWLDRSEAALVLFGRPDRSDICRLAETVDSTLMGAGDHEPKPAIQRRHVRLQQWHGEWPVFGGGATLHATQADDRISANSGYLPIPRDRGFERAISIDRALDLARRALAHYVVGTKSPSFLEELAAEPWLYAGSEVAVLAFAGEYRLAYSIYLAHPRLAEPWGMMIDASTGEALGRPSSLAYQGYAFASSLSALSGTPGITQIVTMGLDPNPCADFMDIERFITPTQSQPIAWPDVEALPQAPAVLGSHEFAAGSVALHSRSLRDYMLSIGADPGRIHPAAQQLKAIVDVDGGNQLSSTYFNPGKRTINFQRDTTGLVGLASSFSSPNPGVLPAAPPVHHPVWDPELVYHEVTHGLMCLINSEPFRQYQQSGQAPFARALVEGYATYFARSFGAGAAPPATSLWAEAAYRTADWGDIWAFGRATRTPGQDLLALPNLFPLGQVSSNPHDIELVYQAGMVWSRALWDARGVLGSQLADSLALAAYQHAAGWVISFEIVAEAMIEAAILRSIAPAAVQKLIDIFAVRNILAQRGVQALANAGAAIIVGSDAELRRLTNDGQAPDPGPFGALQNIVGLAADATAVYAAVEWPLLDGGQLRVVYRSDLAAPNWTPHGAWPATSMQRVLSLAIATNGDLYAGTGRSVLKLPAGAAQDTAWAEPRLLDALALDVAIGQVSGTPIMCVAGFEALRTLVPAAGQLWASITMNNPTTDMVTCLAADGETVFVGTGGAGIWRGTLTSRGSFKRGTKQNICPFVQLNAAVLCLALEPATQTLYAGTTAGVFQAQTPFTNWSMLATAGLPPDAVIARLAANTGFVLAGLSQGGVWRLNVAAPSQLWQQILP
jgi:hypothetical protein